jgi:hypothetical protein
MQRGAPLTGFCWATPRRSLGGALAGNLETLELETLEGDEARSALNGKDEP